MESLRQENPNELLGKTHGDAGFSAFRKLKESMQFWTVFGIIDISFTHRFRQMEELKKEIERCSKKHKAHLRLFWRRRMAALIAKKLNPN